MPSTSTDVSDLMNQITTDVKLIVADEIALVKAEIRPAVRRVGVGSGLFGAAGYFAVSATIIGWFVFASGFAWIYAATTGLSGWGCAFFGILTAMVLVLVIAALFIVFGKRSFSKIEAPHRAGETVGEAFAAVQAGLAEGKERVEAELRSDRP